MFIGKQSIGPIFSIDTFSDGFVPLLSSRGSSGTFSRKLDVIRADANTRRKKEPEDALQQQQQQQQRPKQQKSTVGSHSRHLQKWASQSPKMDATLCRGLAAAAAAAALAPPPPPSPGKAIERGPVEAHRTNRRCKQPR